MEAFQGRPSSSVEVVERARTVGSRAGTSGAAAIGACVREPTSKPRGQGGYGACRRRDLHEVCAIPAKTRFRGDALRRLLRHYGGSMNPDFRMVPLFADLDDAQLEILIGATQRRKLPAGHVLFEKGAVADCWFLLVEGAISRARRGWRAFSRACDRDGR